MALAADPATDANAAAAQLRGMMFQTVQGCRANMAAMRGLVAGRRPAIVAALGAGDAADLLALYGKLNDFVTAATGQAEPAVPTA